MQDFYIQYYLQILWMMEKINLQNYYQKDNLSNLIYIYILNVIHKNI